jgi:hypothetical protein
MFRARTPPAANQGNDVSDIFDEVNEDLRAERARRMLRRYGALLAGMAVLAVLGAGAWQAWQYYQSRQTDREAQAYLAAMRIADAPDATRRQAAIPALENIVAHGNPGYRTLARLREAALKANAGDGAGAAALWNAVAADPSADPLLRGLASLQWATHQIDGGDPAAVAARLAPLAAPNNPWHPLAEEAQGLLAMRQGNNAAARAIFTRLAKDVTAPDGVRGRAGGLASRLGAQAGG